MSDVVDLSVALLRKYAEFTKKLTPEQLTAIATGDLKFTLEGAKKAATKAAIVDVDVDAVSGQLSRLDSREEATAYIDSLGLGAPQLKQLAKDLGASLTGASTKPQVRDRIVEHTVGFRLNSRTIRGGSWTS